jgi:hypothetical protein
MRHKETDASTPVPPRVHEEPPYTIDSPMTNANEPKKLLSMTSTSGKYIGVLPTSAVA